MSSNNAPSFTISMNDPNESTKKSSSPTMDVSTHSEKSLAYILNRNETLDKENKQLRQEMNEMKALLEEEENSNDKNDSRMVHMKGLTKNLVAAKNLCEKMKNSSVKIHDIYKNINQENDNLYNEIRHCNMINIAVFLSIIFMFTLFHSYWLLITFMGVVGGNYHLYSSHYHNIYTNYSKKVDKMKTDIESHENIIKEMEIELRELKNATDFLNDHIDGI